MNSSTILDWVTALGSVATPILVLILTGIGWMISNRIEKARIQEKYYREIEDKLRSDRIAIYNTILEPFIILLSRDEVFAKDKKYHGKTKQDVAQEKMLSLQYRQAAFELGLMGSDGVVRAYNDLMQYFYQMNREGGEYDAKTMVGHLANLLLEIRKGVGNERTALDKFEMLEWLITDIRDYREQTQN